MSLDIVNKSGWGSVIGLPEIGGISFSVGYRSTLSLFGEQSIVSVSGSYYVDVTLEAGIYSLGWSIDDNGSLVSFGAGADLGYVEGAHGFAGVSKGVNSFGVDAAVDAMLGPLGSFATFGIDVGLNYTWGQDAYTPGLAFSAAMSQEGNSAYLAGVAGSAYDLASTESRPHYPNLQFAYDAVALQQLYDGTLEAWTGWDSPKERMTPADWAGQNRGLVGAIAVEGITSNAMRSESTEAARAAEEERQAAIAKSTDVSGFGSYKTDQAIAEAARRATEADARAPEQSGNPTGHDVDYGTSDTFGTSGATQSGNRTGHNLGYEYSPDVGFLGGVQTGVQNPSYTQAPTVNLVTGTVPMEVPDYTPITPGTILNTIYTPDEPYASIVAPAAVARARVRPTPVAPVRVAIPTAVVPPSVIVDGQQSSIPIDILGEATQTQIDKGLSAATTRASIEQAAARLGINPKDPNLQTMIDRKLSQAGMSDHTTEAGATRSGPINDVGGYSTTGYDHNGNYSSSAASHTSGPGPSSGTSSTGGTSSTSGTSATSSNDHAGHYNGDSSGSSSSKPVVLDLSGNGLSVDTLSTSSQFLDLDGDGYQHRTAWAGAGNGVLALDLYGDGKIHQQNQFAFTKWDQSATGDLQALKDVFDTNHNGKLDAGDTDWSLFKVMVNGQMVSLASLGITSIDLTPTGSGQTFSDGSAITGTTTYTKSDGTTGQVGDAVLASDSNGYLIHQTQTTNADGSVTTDILGDNADGSEAFENVVTVSANGLNKTIKYDDAGNGVFDRTQTDNTVVNADGSRTATSTNFNVDGSVKDRTARTITADTKTVTTLLDQNGDGIWDQSEIFVSNADGSTSTTTKQLATNGAMIHQVAVTTSANGLIKTTNADHAGTGSFDYITTDTTAVNADGSRVETVTDTGNNGTLLDKTVTTTSADARSKTVRTDHAGAGSFDEVTTSSIVINTDNSLTETVSTYNGAGTTLIGTTVTTTSADGLTNSVKHYLDGGASPVDTAWDIVSIGADGSRTEQVLDYSLNGALLSKSVTVISGDKKTITTNTDVDGNGLNDVSITATTNADGSVTTVTSTYNATGGLASKSTETVSASGLSTTTATDLNGDSAVDQSKTDLTVLSADGSKTKTVSNFNASGGLKDKIVVATSANGLSVTMQMDGTGAGTFSRTNTDVTTLNADGSTAKVVSDLNANGTLHDKATTTISANKMTVTTTRDINGDGTADQTVMRQVNGDGSVTISSMDGTVQSASGRSYGATDGRYETDSANGLSTTVQYDANGHGLAQNQTTVITVLNADGSKVETITDAALTGGVASSAAPVYTVTTKDKEVITISASGLAVTKQFDLTGVGAFGESLTDQTVLNTDGSRTETITGTKAGVQTGKYVLTTSADGLSTTRQWSFGSSSSPSETSTDVKVINADGTATETVTNTGSSGSLLSKSVTTTSVDGRNVSTQQDTTGSGSFNQGQTDSTVTLADGSDVTTVSDLNGNGTLRDKTVTQTSTDGRISTISSDANGDGVIDQTEVRTTAVDGSATDVIADVTAGVKVHQITSTTTFDGLTTNTSWDFNGDGVVDRTRTDGKAYNADGSYAETQKDYQTSATTATGWGAAITAVLLKTTTETVSADGRTKTIAVKLNSDTSADETSTTVTAIDGSAVTTTTNDAAAKAVAPLPGQVLWNSTIATSNKTVASKLITTVSADGLSKTIQADYDGNGTYEHTETWQSQIDGSQIGTIQDVRATGTVAASGTETISADGLTTTLKEDTDNNGTIDHTDTATTHVDGSITETVSEYNTNGTLKKTVATYVTPDGQSTSIVTTTPPTSTGALATSTTVITGSGTTTTEAGSVDTATINGNNNVLTVASGQETATVSGTGNTVNVNGNASASVTGGTGTVVNFNSSGNTLSATSETINLATGRTVTIGGTGNTIVINANETVTLAGSNWTDSDTFVFQPNFGHSTLTSALSTVDPLYGNQVNVSHTVFADWAHLLAASSQSGSDVIITADANDTITLKNTTLATVQSHQSAFHFT